MTTGKFFICFIIMACACGIVPISSVQARPIKMCPVVALEGSWREIGEQTAYYFRDTIVRGAFMFSVLGVTAKKAETYYDGIEGLIPQDIKEQMEGMADGLSALSGTFPALPRSKELIWNFSMDIMSRRKSGCTAFAFGSPEGTFLAHNTDNVGLTVGMNTVIHYKPDNGDYSFLSFFAPGFVGVGMGINDQKLALSFNVGEPNHNQQPGLPVVFKAREVMAKCDNLRCAVKKFEQFLGAGGNYGELGANLMIVDFKDSAMARLQICSDVITVTYLERPDFEEVTYGAVTNHFEGGDCAIPAPNGSGPFTWLSRIFRGNRKDSSHQRYERLIQLLTSAGISYDMQTCWWILTDSRGTLPNDNTICRKGPLITTTASHVLTERFCYYSLGLPSKYLKKYGKLLFIDLDDGLRRAVKPSITGTAKGRDEPAVPSAPIGLISLSERGVRLKTYTDSDGSFTFNNLDAGTYKLRNGRKPLNIRSPGKVINYDGETIVTVDNLLID